MLGYCVLSLFEEIAAYEALWDHPNTTFKKIANQLANHPFDLASKFVDPQCIAEYKRHLLPILTQLPHFGARINGDGMYPERLKDALHPLKVFYYQGNWELIYQPCVAIVGTRQPTPEGVERAKYLVKKLVADQFAIVSGLARGIDTVAHQTAIDIGGITVAVIGTPLNHHYPPENLDLQNRIAKDFLLISQVPFVKYSKQTYLQNRLFFPERNITMAALTQATIIVEAGETSGTLVQAKAALQQKRKLIILENNFQNKSLSWPQKLEQMGAIRAKDYNDIKTHLSHTPQAN